MYRLNTPPLIPLLALGLFAAGCPAGRGEGWVTGSLWVDSCKEGASLRRDGDYDLEADFFAGDPLFDTVESQHLRRSKLLIRMQATSNPIIESDSLAIQFLDLGYAARSFVRREGIAFSDDGLLPDAVETATQARMQLQLFNSCPSSRSAVSALPWALTEQTTESGERCAMAGDLNDRQPGCPNLSANDLVKLEAICAEPDFNERGSRDELRRILGSGPAPACMFLCQLGDLSRDTPIESLTGYGIDYDQEVAALFHARLIDPRAVRLHECARASAELSGRFRFTLVRSRVAQPFP